MFTPTHRYTLFSIVAVGLISATALVLTDSGKAIANSHSGEMTLNCIGRLGDSAKQDGMTLEYNAQSNKVTVSFIKVAGARTAGAGQCVLNGMPWNSKSIGKFCHFGVSDVIYKRNKSSINIISRQAPYILKVVKTGEAFSLKVRANDARCPNGGLTVVN